MSQSSEREREQTPVKHCLVERTWHNHDTGTRQVPQQASAYAVVVVPREDFVATLARGVMATCMQAPASKKMSWIRREERACSATKGGNRCWDQLARLVIKVARGDTAGY